MIISHLINASKRAFSSNQSKKEEAKNDEKKPPPPCSHRTIAAAPDETYEPAGPCLECKAEKQAARNYRTRIILGLILPYALQALDVTIALPWIAADFGKLSQQNWIVSVFNLTSACFIPFWGTTADVFGRHWALQSSLILMLIGSALCTGAPLTAYGVLLLGRALQGAACAGLAVVVRVVMADKVSLKENARNWTIFALTGGSCYGLGPVVGGYLTNVHWRWCFAINLPIAVLGVLVVFFVLRRDLLGPQPVEIVGVEGGPRVRVEDVGRRTRFVARLKSIDFGGQALFLVGFALLILAFTWAGTTYQWSHPAIIVPLVVGALVAGGWMWWEYSMSPDRALGRRLYFQKPMLSWKLLQDRNISLLFYINFATGMAMYAVLYFVSIYFTVVMHYDASDAGVQLLYYTPGLAAGAYLSMLFCNTWPRQTFLPLFLGSLSEAIGVGLMAWALYFEKKGTIFAMMAVTGAGTGLRMLPGSLHAIGFFPDHVATVVSLMAVAMPFGGTLALTIMSTVFNNTSGAANGLESVDFDDPVAAKNGVTWAFVSLVPFMVICVLASACLGNVTILKEGGESSGSDSTTSDDTRNDVKLMRGSYLLALLGGEGSRQTKINDGHEMQSASETTRIYP
ncbi:putative mfs multidrug transporter protein [Eutypa lata UCREL1]|uniref:Putative mfs multidrug transporter protein n=1 Tax=Eutypa lata (strain UCR-EL1) TaxID=1287681 RepID=M7TYZ8_EUTLA|nr:putative mfs multidrug transporter protein [Eutypa lata UCREL1]